MKTINIIKMLTLSSKSILKLNKTLNPITLQHAKYKNAIKETNYLNSISGMVDSLKKGMATPLEECIREEDISW
ncbi:MAG: type II toxin-antitoxin system Phd/YefM family antitoxin [Treponema sp.]